MPWFWRGLGVRVPALDVDGGAEPPPGSTPGRPVDSVRVAGLPGPGICPTGALRDDGASVRVDLERCVFCMRCRYHRPAMDWVRDRAWPLPPSRALPGGFAHSIHVRIVDAGDCGGCLNELRQLVGPIYSLHRFGVFVTATPRDADVLAVVGPVTEAMATALAMAYAAMPEPKRVIAIGVCALNGGVFAGSFAVRGGAAAVVPVDVRVPGCPPPPLAILEALRSLMAKAPTARDGGEAVGARGR